MNSFGAKSVLEVGPNSFDYYRLGACATEAQLNRLPFSLRVLLENLLRTEDGVTITRDDVQSVLAWDPKATPDREISFTPGRVLLQDFTGVPCVVDLAAMRDAIAKFGGDPKKINPLQPVELVIDHSVQVDAYGSEAALQINRDLEYSRNQERYEFLRWGQQAFDNFKVVPPNTGIVHQVNLEYLARVVMTNGKLAYFDTLVGTDSHTTMINGLGVLGWGVGGIEAEAAMLGQPVSMLIPQVVGFKLNGKLSEGVTATDLVLTVTEMLRAHGVVGKFVEFYGAGVCALPLADRATIANMAPEYGATMGFFPIDEETLRYLRVSGREESQIALVEAYAKAQGMFLAPDSPEAEYTSYLELDLSTVEPSVAGPKRPQDRILLRSARESYYAAFPNIARPGSATATATLVKPAIERNSETELTDGDVVIAAITSCTNTSNPSVMVAAGIVARKAAALGLKPKPWVKTSLAPGSKVVTEYLTSSGLISDLDKIGFNVVGYGCTTCIGNSGPLPEEISKQIQAGDLTVVSVLSGNRNFEGRVNAEVKANYLMSPPLVVAYALAGTIQIDLTTEPIGIDDRGNPVFLKDIWPTQHEVAEIVGTHIRSDMFRRMYNGVFEGDEKWQGIAVSASEQYDWNPTSTYVKRAPYFDDMPLEAPSKVKELTALRCIAVLGDSITTDHISPAGSIKSNSPAGSYLSAHNVSLHLFNSYGSRRGNHEVMVRGTFANIRLRNQIAPGTEGGFTTYWPTEEVTTIFDASEKYAAAGIGVCVLGGKEYGSGSSRDWAAKGPNLLGIKFVLAESFERIHRSNLVGMGILPLQFTQGESVASLGLTGKETFSVIGLADAVASGFANGKEIEVRVEDESGNDRIIKAIVRIDTPKEIEYYRHGGILLYVLRSLLKD